MSSQSGVAANDAFRFNRYGPLCTEVYVLDKPPGALGDIGYYRERLAGAGPALEAGCGSGRLLVPMREAGLDWRGFDRSSSMLAACRAALDARGLNADLSQMSFADFTYPERFAGIVCPVGTFTLIDDFDAGLAALRRFHAHMSPGGRVFIDVGSLGQLAARHDGVRTWEDPAGDLLRLESRPLRVDYATQRLSYDLRYERWRDGRLVAAELETMSVRAWGLRELDLALREAGFADVTVCGDYREGVPATASSQFWCFQAVRA